MRIHISEATATLLRGSHFLLEQRGRVEVKVRRTISSLSLPTHPLVVCVQGKGLMTTYWVVGIRDGASRGPTPPVSPRPLAQNLLTPNPSRKKLSPEPHQWPRADLLTRRRSAPITVECPYQSGLGPEGPNLPGLGSALQLSELNMLHIRESLSMGGLGAGGEELTQFVTLAEENARQARLVADLASDLVGRVTSADGDSRITSSDQAQPEPPSYYCIIL